MYMFDDLQGHKLCVLGPHMQALRALDLSFCNSLDSQVLPFAISQFPALTHLNLSLCRSLLEGTALELSDSSQLQVRAASAGFPLHCPRSGFNSRS